MNQENRPVVDDPLKVQQRQQRLQLHQQEQRDLQQRQLLQQQQQLQQPQQQRQPQEQQNSSEQQEQEQQPAVNKPMEKDLNLREYKNLIPKTIAEIQAIHERGKKLYSKRKHYKREPYPPPAPRELTKEEKLYKKLQREKDIKEYRDSITYSSYYYDEVYEYRHVILPKMIARWLPPIPKLMDREEWLSYGVSQSLGWVHYMVYAPEPHILLFRRDREKYASSKSSKPEESEDMNVKNDQGENTTEDEVEQVEKEELVTSEIAPVRPTAYARISRSTRANAVDTIRK